MRPTCACLSDYYPVRCSIRLTCALQNDSFKISIFLDLHGLIDPGDLHIRKQNILGFTMLNEYLRTLEGPHVNKNIITFI